MASGRSRPMDMLASEADQRVGRIYDAATRMVPQGFMRQTLEIVGATGAPDELRWSAPDSNDDIDDPMAPDEGRVRLNVEGHGFSYPVDHPPAWVELLPHLVFAWRINQRLFSDLALTARSPERVLGEPGHALVDASGRILDADARFMDLLTDGGRPIHRLPFALTWSDRVERLGVTHAGLFIRVARNGSGFRLLAVPDRRGSALTEREWQIVHEFARGKSYKQIAQVLDIAASTASTHVHNAYQKLGFTRRSELVEWLRRQPMRV